MAGPSVTRRQFLAGSAIGAAAIATGGVSAAANALTRVDPATSSAPWIEATVPQLQAMMARGQLTSVELTRGYLDRIAHLNGLLHAVIETNPRAESIAAERDRERRAGRLRGPLHGIPVIVKDNIATADSMQTTAGSLALVGSRVPADATVVARLRASGAVVLGKANLSEWANFRGNAPFNGWSARGGFTRDPYVLSFDPCGSSSGSAVAVAANLASIGVGTETDGSVVCPSGNNMIVGLKPTIGLVSQSGIIPIAHSQDTAGPMTRTVTDNAILLGVMQTGFAGIAPRDYGPFLRRGALRGKRIGVDRRYFTADFGGGAAIDAVVEAHLDVFRQLGATLVDTETPNPDDFGNDEFTVLLFEFKVQIAQYLATLSNTSMRTLEDLIRFDSTHCDAEMKYFGQQVFEAAQATSGNLNDPEYVAARRRCLALTRAGGIDGAMQRDDLDALIAPSYSFASSPAAVAGYPNISVPIGFTGEGDPVGVWMYAGHLQEAKLLAFAFDLEQELEARRPPQLRGHVPPLPPDAGICAAEPGPAAAAIDAPAARAATRLSRHL